MCWTLAAKRFRRISANRNQESAQDKVLKLPESIPS
jgi:hypothetical protein